LQGAFTGAPKTRTPAYLIAGDHDELDPGAGTPNSDTSLFAVYLLQGGAPAYTVIVHGPAGSHIGPTQDLSDPTVGSFYNLALG